MKRFIPPRNVLAGGVAAIAAWGLTQAVQAAFGVYLDPEASSAIVGGVAVLVGYVVPPSVADVVRRVDDRIIDAAVRSPESKATREGAMSASLGGDVRIAGR